MNKPCKLLREAAPLVKPRLRLHVDGRIEVKTPTPAQASAELKRRGLSIAAWSRQHGLTPSLVYEILGGHAHRRCLRGQSHRAAVLLGIKDGELAA